MDTALGDHVARNRRVDAAGEQAHRVAAHPERQAARGALGGGMDIGGVLADLDIDRQLRVVDVDAQVRKRVVQLAADPLADLNGAHGEALVGALCLDLEALCRAQRVREIELRRLENRLFALLAGLGAGDGDDAL